MRLKSTAGAIFLFFLCAAGFSQTPANDPAAVAPVVEPKNDHSRNVNIDMQVVYGQYNNMLSTINLSHEQENSVYLLSSYFKRSNDFGYNGSLFENSSFNENRIGYTGNFNPTDSLKSILEAEVNNDSRGMFDNPTYSREEKDKARMSIKNIAKLTSSFEGYITVGGAEYRHRLNAIAADGSERSRLNHVTTEIGGEYIWSASNRIRGNVLGGHYFYQGDIPSDRYFSGELIDDFNITPNIGLSFGVNVDVNRDEKPLAFPVVGVTLKGFQYTTFSLLYRCDLIPFRPEEFYLEQKYIMPTYDLPPGRVHHGDARLEVRVNDIVSIKAGVVVENNNNFYNYYTVTPGDVLSAETIEATTCASHVDSRFLLFEEVLEISLRYEYNYFIASEHITYRPRQNFGSAVKYNGKIWRFEWSNKLAGKVYADPDGDGEISGAVIGVLGLQRRMLESFYAYVRVENLYNARYNLREGYPEPGITFLGGLRILI
ncbi:MAG TPA: hypothetical protein VLM75_00660 [Spirochaetota bacterium]|nr:hypothetical protein [Spirochaetota bacterium]